jgi:hypothetical protein
MRRLEGVGRKCEACLRGRACTGRTGAKREAAMARHETRSTLAHVARQRMLRARALALPPRPLPGWSAAEHRPASAWRLLPPLFGVAISLLAWYAQNVWHLFHIGDVTDGIRSLDAGGLALALFVIGAIEGTVVICFYLPGTAVVILLFAACNPPGARVCRCWPRSGPARSRATA